MSAGDGGYLQGILGMMMPHMMQQLSPQPLESPMKRAKTDDEDWGDLFSDDGHAEGGRWDKEVASDTER